MKWLNARRIWELHNNDSPGDEIEGRSFHTFFFVELDSINIAKTKKFRYLAVSFKRLAILLKVTLRQLYSTHTTEFQMFLILKKSKTWYGKFLIKNRNGIKVVFQSKRRTKEKSPGTKCFFSFNLLTSNVFEDWCHSTTLHILNQKNGAFYCRFFIIIERKSESEGAPIRLGPRELHIQSSR